MTELNFVRLTQVIERFGKPERVIEKVYPHTKDFLLERLRRQIKDVPGGFWVDLYRRSEAVLEDRFGGKVTFKIEPVNGDEYTDEKDSRTSIS